MHIKVYSKPACIFCERAKHLIKRIDWDTVIMDEIMIGRDIERDDFIAQFPEAKTVPQIYVNDVLIGGFDKFEIWYNTERLKLSGVRE